MTHAEFIVMLTKVTEIRAKNNLNWMAILELAHRGYPKETEILISEVTKKDKEITNLFGGIGK